MRSYKVNLVYAPFGSFKNGYTIHMITDARNEYDAVRKVLNVDVLWVDKIGVAFIPKNATAIIPMDVTDEVFLNY